MNAAAVSLAGSASTGLDQSSLASHDIYLHSTREALVLQDALAGFARVFESPEMAKLLRISDPVVAERLAQFFKELSTKPEGVALAEILRVTEVISVAERSTRGADTEVTDFHLSASRGVAMLRFGEKPRAFLSFETSVGPQCLMVRAPSVGISGNSPVVALIAETICGNACWSGPSEQGLEPARAVQQHVDWEIQSRANFLP